MTLQEQRRRAIDAGHDARWKKPEHVCQWACPVVDEIDAYAEAVRVEARASNQALREALERSASGIEMWANSVEHEVERTIAWRNAKGMRPASDASDYSSVPPSGLTQIRRLVRELRALAADARREGLDG